MTTSRNAIDLEQSHAELHDLCQPLTALQCRLELGRMLGHAGALEESIDGALEETRRMFEVIAQMRQRLLGIEEGAHQYRERQEIRETERREIHKTGTRKICTTEA
jgi:C4-dicarboxylate-specific signal transduction histidine kinase